MHQRHMNMAEYSYPAIWYLPLPMPNLPLAPPAQRNIPDGSRLAASLDSHHPRIRAGHGLGLNLDSVEVSLLPVWVIAEVEEPPRHWASVFAAARLRYNLF